MPAVQVAFSNSMETTAHTLGRQAAERAREAATRIKQSHTTAATTDNVAM